MGLRTLFSEFYFCSGASTGQTLAHAPHSRHSSGLITYLPSFSEMAPTGHSSAQLPHPRHFSASITYAITVILSNQMRCKYEFSLAIYYNILFQNVNVFAFIFVIIRYRSLPFAAARSSPPFLKARSRLSERRHIPLSSVGRPLRSLPLQVRRAV